jgi:O-acetyl-ADP-ribose deacetylase (regulator of RNase III)
VIDEIKSGDLFKAQTEALVNPVNTEGVMGAGLAREFRRRYPVMYQEYAQICKRRMLYIGAVHFWPTGENQPRFIVNLPTKRTWREASQPEWIDAGLVELRTQLEIRDIWSVAIPALGCGLGGLQWDRVRSLVYRTFGATNLIRVCLYPPRPPAPPRKRARKRARA